MGALVEKNQRRGGEFDILLSLAPSRVLKRIQGRDKDFRAKGSSKEKEE